MLGNQDWLFTLALQMREDVENGAAPRLERLTVSEFLENLVTVGAPLGSLVISEID